MKVFFHFIISNKISKINILFKIYNAKKLQNS